MKQFWALVENSLRLKSSETWKSTNWWKLYKIFFILLLLLGYSFLIYRGIVTPFTSMIVIPYLIPIILSLAIASIRREWKNQTVAWWLTLPYSRFKLILTKFVANLIRFFKISGIAYILITIITIEGMLLNPEVWTLKTVTEVLKDGFNLLLLAIAISPVWISLGMLLGFTMQPRLKPIVPIVWLITGIIFSFGSRFTSNLFIIIFKGSRMPLDFSFNQENLIAGVIFYLIVSVISLRISSYILDNYTEV